MGVAGGATRAALVQHQARRDNMADVSAKDGSQVNEKGGLVLYMCTVYMCMVLFGGCPYSLQCFRILS